MFFGYVPLLSSHDRNLSLPLSFQQFQLFFHLGATHLRITYRGTYRWGSFHGDMSQIIGKLFQRPAGITGAVRKIVAQIMKREVSDQLPLLVVGTPFEATEPLVNAIFGETRTPLGGKDIRAGMLTPAVLEVVVQGTARLVQQIDVTELLTLLSDMEPANLWTDMGVFYQQVRYITHAAPGPVPQSEDRFAAQVALFLEQIVQDEPLVRGEYAGSQGLLRFDLHPTGRVACQSLLLLNEPLAKPVEHRFDAGAVADTVPLLLEDGQIPFHGGCRELVRNKLPALSWKLRHPCRELAQNPHVGIHRRLVASRVETVLLIALNDFERDEIDLRDDGRRQDV